MSHAREIKELAKVRKIKKYPSSVVDIWGSKKTSSEVPVSKHITCGRHMKNTAVQDLKRAYDSVPQPRLMPKVKQKLRQNMHNITVLPLQPLKSNNKGI